jgi:acyl-[acyl-carrier-protein] desaturase
VIRPDPNLIAEIEAQRPAAPPGLLSRAEKDRLIERAVVGLYRWYLDHSQTNRNWNPDRSFDWRALRTDHSFDLNVIIEGYFAVEQYVPDYTRRTIEITRQSHGRSQFQIRWGAEEERHADLWLNTLLFSRFRSPQWIEDYKHTLREQVWELPWDDAFHMVLYALVQERATQVNYLNTAMIARGESDKPQFAGDADPVLAKIAQTIAVDEAAHYNFFLEITRLHLYYYPTETLEALWEIVENFAMPGMELVPERPRFGELLHRGAVYGPRQFTRDVVQVVIESLTIKNRKAFLNGVKRSRQVPDPDGNLRDTAIFETLDYSAIETMVQRLFSRVEKYEKEIGFADIDPTQFTPSGLASP